jgi:two-component system, NtrC family, nitrogen regulation sensor histidine kinase NtrY
MTTMPPADSPTPLHTTLFRRVFLSLALIVGVVLAVVFGSLWLLLQWTFEHDFQAMHATSETLLAGETRAMAEGIVRQIRTLADDAQVRRELVQLLADPDDLERRQQMAADLARRTDLDFFSLLDGNGTILSSAHWRRGFGTRLRNAAAIFASKEHVLLLRQEQVQEGYALRLVPALEVLHRFSENASSPPVYVLAGYRFDRAFLERWSLLCRGVVAYLPVGQPALWGTTAQIPERPGNPDSGWEGRIGGGDHRAAPLHDLEIVCQWPGRFIVAYPLGKLREVQHRLLLLVAVSALFGLVAALTVGRRLARRITAPVGGLMEGARRLAEGTFEPLEPPGTGDELDALVRAFNAMAGELHAKEAALLRAERLAAWRDIARKIAHEIKNPLFPIRLSIETLQRSFRRRPEDFERLFTESTETVLQEVERINHIVSAFSRFAQMPAPQPEPCALAEIVEHVVRLYENEGGVTVTARGEELPLLHLDRGQMTQVLVNLVKNALEAVGETGEVLISWGLNSDPGWAVLSVADNGPGLSEELLASAFQPGFTTKGEGLGLGLALVQKIVQEHGGEVTLANRPEGGAVVTMLLPLPEEAS